MLAQRTSSATDNADASMPASAVVWNVNQATIINVVSDSHANLFWQHNESMRVTTCKLLNIESGTCV